MEKGKGQKNKQWSINNFLDGYKELILCLCSHQCIRDVMMQRMQVSKGYGRKKVLRMGHFKLTLQLFFGWECEEELW
jgi:hypothetical protein